MKKPKYCCVDFDAFVKMGHFAALPHHIDEINNCEFVWHLVFKRENDCPMTGIITYCPFCGKRMALGDLLIEAIKKAV